MFIGLYQKHIEQKIRQIGNYKKEFLELNKTSI